MTVGIHGDFGNDFPIRDADSDGSDSGDADDNDSVRYPGSLLGCQDAVRLSASGV